MSPRRPDTKPHLIGLCANVKHVNASPSEPPAGDPTAVPAGHPTTDADPDIGDNVTGPELLNLSEVTRRNGVSVDTLRLLVENRLLPGVERGPRGHVKVRADQVPTYANVVGLLTRQLEGWLLKAQAQMRRVYVEMEAVNNDLQLALEDPLADLGHDLSSLRVISRDPHASTLTSALTRLEMITWDIRRYQDALRDLTRVLPAQTD